MIPYPDIGPIAVQLGPIPIRWYSLGYIVGVGVGWWYATQLIKSLPLWPKNSAGEAQTPISRLKLDDLVYWVALGMIAGGRIGYVLFYEPNLLFAPWGKLGGVVPFPPALMLWQGGLSFHGGLLGVTISGLLFCRKNNLNPLGVADILAACAPFAVFLVRIANFINAELYGRPWDGPWSMVFPTDPLGVARHPSQLYEAFLEGFVLFIVLRIATHHFGFFKRRGAVTGLFLSGYALSRIFVENFREPDSFLPDFPLDLTMGMMLSTPMLGLGLFLIWRAFKAAPLQTKT